MSFELRPYQAEAVKAVEREWRSGNRRTLVAQATGTGKTIVMAELARRVSANDGRVLLLAHRGELLDQAADKFERAADLSCAREQASSTGIGTMDPVVVGSVQTMMRDNRLMPYDHDYFTHVFVDEAHHAVADSYRKILDHFRGAKVVGVTATPDRSDKRGLAEVFDSIAYEYGMRDAIEDGWLCPISAQMLPVRVDISRVRVQNGDYAASDLGDALEPYLDSIADEMSEKCRGMRTVVFLPLVSTSKDFAERLRMRGMRVCEVNGNSPDRAEKLADFQAGRYDVITNALLLTEGWDCPSVDCIVNLRPTKSRSLFTQIVGRGTRLYPGKKSLLLLDFLWQTSRHNLCRPASLLGASEEVEERVSRKVSSAVPVDLLAAESEAIGDMQAERESSLAEQLKANKDRPPRTFDPMQFAIWIGDMDLQEYEPTFKWERDPVTDKQAAILAKNGFDVAGMTKGMAAKIIDAIIKRNDKGLATPRMVKQLEWHGFSHPDRWTREQAGEMMNMLAENGWKVPAWIDPSTYTP